jgi:FkbM family methyltransferase
MISKNALQKDLTFFLANKKYHPTFTNEYETLNANILHYLSSKIEDDCLSFDLLGYNFRVNDTSFGTVSCTDLFSLFELILFAFYKKHLSGLNVADIGANIGAHTLAMFHANAKHIDSYEPDRESLHARLSANLRLNRVPSSRQSTIYSAVSCIDTTSSFVRILGNSTSSHLSGLKMPYGDVETFDVNVVNFGRVINLYNFAKIDAEGAEVDILSSINPSSFDHFSCFIEIGSSSDRLRLESTFNKLYQNKVFFFPQSLSWCKASSIDDLPSHWSHGNCFVGKEFPSF